MKNLYFNRQTLMGEAQKLTSIILSVPDSFSLTKEVEEICGRVQKVDSNGNSLYLREIYVEKEIPYIQGYDETIKPNDKPVMITIQKTDGDGKKLYLEAIIDEETKEIVDYLETPRLYDEYGNMNEPIMLETHKTSISGAPLYYVPVMGVRIEKILEHVEETTEVTDTPNIIDISIPVVRSLEASPEVFSINEVIFKLLTDKLNDSSYDYLFADYFLNTDSINLDESIVSTGTQIMQIPMGGSLVTKLLEIEGKAKNFFLLDPLPAGLTMYVNSVKVEDNVVTLPSPVTSITIRVVNEEGRAIDLDHYCLALNMEEELNSNDNTN